MLRIKRAFSVEKRMVSIDGLRLNPLVNFITPVDLLAEFLEIKGRALELTLLKALWRQILVKLLHDHFNHSIDRLFAQLNLWLKHQRNQKRVSKLGRSQDSVGVADFLMELKNMFHDIAHHGFGALIRFEKLILNKEFVNKLLNLRPIDLIFLNLFKLTQNHKHLNIMNCQLRPLVI